MVDEFVDLLDAMDEKAKHLIHFTLWPRMWKNYTNIHTWQTEKLEASKADQIPDAPGIYTLLLKPGIAGHCSCSYLMYVGKAVSLRTRFREYLGKERRPSGRPRIFKFLQKYDNYICFCFTEVDEALLEAIEDGLMDAYLPPLNVRYKGTMSKIMGAFT